MTLETTYKGNKVFIDAELSYIQDEDGVYEFIKINDNALMIVDGIEEEIASNLIEITDELKEILRDEYIDKEEIISIHRNPMRAYGMALRDFI